MSFKFDNQIEVVNKMRTAAAGVAEVALKFPSDDDWNERARKTRHLHKSIGRGITEPSVEYGDVDLRIYERVKLNGSPALTELEATRMMELCASAAVTKLELAGDGAQVEMKVMGGTVRHSLERLPTTDEAHKLNKSALMRQHPRGLTEFRIYLEPAAKLYDACGGKSEDYLYAIPVIHKYTVIREVINEIERELEPGGDENL